MSKMDDKPHIVSPDSPQSSPSITQPEITQNNLMQPPQPSFIGESMPPHRKTKLWGLIVLLVVIVLAVTGGLLYEHIQKTPTTASLLKSVTPTQPVEPQASSLPATWSSVTSPNVYLASSNTSTSNVLNAVSCVSTNDCWSVGDYNLANATGNKSLAEHWDGKAWSIVSTPNLTGEDNQLNSVSCVSVSDCWVVGGTSGYDSPMVFEHWNGTSWQLKYYPDNVETGDLEGVTCTSTSNCWAVGNLDESNFSLNSLVMKWNGSIWASVSTPNSTQSEFDSVSCVNVSDCFIVGDTSEGSNDDGISDQLIERWNGSAWKTMVTQDPYKHGAYMPGIDCTKESSCIALIVPSNGTAGTDATSFVVEQWNGTSWADTTYPDPTGLSYIIPQAITCSSSTDCQIVGTESTTQDSATILAALHWNGSKWTADNGLVTPAAPAPGPQNGPAPPAFSGVACTSASYCFAVGSYSNASNNNQETLTELFSLH
jgi:hypothetical protein